MLDWEDTCARCEQLEMAAHVGLLGVAAQPLGALIRDVGYEGLPGELYRRVGAAMTASERFQEVRARRRPGLGGAGRACGGAGRRAVGWAACARPLGGLAASRLNTSRPRALPALYTQATLAFFNLALFAGPLPPERGVVPIDADAFLQRLRCAAWPARLACRACSLRLLRLARRPCAEGSPVRQRPSSRGPPPPAPHLCPPLRACAPACLPLRSDDLLPALDVNPGLEVHPEFVRDLPSPVRLSSVRRV